MRVPPHRNVSSVWIGFDAVLAVFPCFPGISDPELVTDTGVASDTHGCLGVAPALVCVGHWSPSIAEAKRRCRFTGDAMTQRRRGEPGSCGSPGL